MMDPRKLVGMTMGARKREARSHADYANLGLPVPKNWHIDTPYHEYRRNLRLGERLRPCPWRHDAKGCMGKGWEGPGPGVDYCDGSGVLPARRARHG